MFKDAKAVLLQSGILLIGWLSLRFKSAEMSNSSLCLGVYLFVFV